MSSTDRCTHEANAKGDAPYALVPRYTCAYMRDQTRARLRQKAGY